MIHHWKSLELEITDSEYHHDPAPPGETIPSKISKMVCVREKVLIKLTYYVSLERS